MKENQTLIIAGLILDETNSHVNKVPYLGDIPWAGALFRNTYYHHEKTELVMTVTPQIVRPIPASGQLELPIERGQMTSDEVRTKPLERPDVTRPRLQ
jgi:Flp pilus assembly secretin CpaC